MLVRDPVCGMEIESDTARIARYYMCQEYLFCSQACAATFDADPARYAEAAPAYSAEVPDEDAD